MTLKFSQGSPTLFRCIVISASLIVLHLSVALSPFEKFLHRGQVSYSPRLIDNYKGFKIYEYMGYYYGLDEFENPMDIRQIHTTSKYSWAGHSDIKILKAYVDKEEDLLIRTNRIISMYSGLVVSSTISNRQITPNSPLWIAQKPPQYPEWMVLKFLKPVVIKVFSINSHTDNKEYIQYHPKDFTFQGSMNGSDWIDLMRTENNVYIEDLSWHEWQIQNNTAYLYYRIFVTAGNADMLSIVEIRFS